MDSLSDRDLEGIWDRVKRYIATDRIKGGSKKEVLEQIEELLSQQREVEGKSGSCEILVRKGFATEGAFGRTKTFEDNLSRWLWTEGGGVKPKPTSEPITGIKGIKDTLGLFKVPDSKIRTLEGGRIQIRGKGRPRIFKGENVQISIGKWKDKDAYYVSNYKTGKRLSWGVMKDGKRKL